MIYIKVEMWPKGYRGGAYTLAEMKITNDGTGDARRGNYYAELSKRGGFEKGIWKRAICKDFDRENRGVLDLIYIMLAYALKNRNRKHVATP